MKKLTLDKLLVLIDEKYGIIDNIMLADRELTVPFIDENGHGDAINWDLTKKTLEEQSERCQEAIERLLISTIHN